jgi:hypothetical protein
MVIEDALRFDDQSHWYCVKRLTGLYIKGSGQRFVVDTDRSIMNAGHMALDGCYVLLMRFLDHRTHNEQVFPRYIIERAWMIDEQRWYVKNV